RVQSIEVAARHSGHGVQRRGRQRVAVLHHPRRRAFSRQQRRLQPLRRSHFGDGRHRQDPGRRHDEVPRSQGLVKKGGFSVVVFVLAALTMAACGYSDPYASTGPISNLSPGPTAAPSPTPGADDFNAGGGVTSCARSATPPCVTYPDGLRVIDLKIGTGDTAVKGMNAEVQYTGWLTDGT